MPTPTVPTPDEPRPRPPIPGVDLADVLVDVELARSLLVATGDRLQAAEGCAAPELVSAALHIVLEALRLAEQAATGRKAAW